MTRGPLPAEAIRQAMRVAKERGTVLERDFVTRARVAFILFRAGFTIFVKVRRTRHRLIDPEECASEFRTDILQLRRIPLTGVTGRELWLLSPWGTWQYFQVHDDRLVEIRGTGAPVLVEGAGIPVSPPGETEPAVSP